MHPNKLSPELFDKSILEMLIHEIGRDFRKGAFTIAVLFDSPQEWARRLRGKLRPDMMLRDQVTRGVNLIMEQYLRFLDHADSLSELWKYLAEYSTAPYALGELQRRLRVMHSWRLDLRDGDVRRRFENITAVLVRALDSDDDLAKIGFDTSEVVARIERLCQDWSGDEGLTLNLPSDQKRGGSSKAA